MIAAFGPALWHWLCTNHVLRVMLQTHWSVEAGVQVRVELSRALALRSEIRRGLTQVGFVIFVSLSSWPVAPATAASDAPLRTPFDVEAIRTTKGGPIAVAPCPEPVPPI